MLLYICRHGQTDHNVQGIIQGHLDTPLNDHGRVESQRLADALASVNFDEAYASPLSRAYETASIVMERHPEIQLRSDDLLKERCLGSMEGRRRKRGERAPADAESAKELSMRILHWLDTVLKGHTISKPPADTPASDLTDRPNVLIVSHGAWISNLIGLLMYKSMGIVVAPGVDVKSHVLNTSVTKVRLWQTKDGWRGEILSAGDISHLDGLNEPNLDVVDDVKD